MEKIVYVPGWMNRAEYDGFSPGLDIWGSKVDPNEKIDAEYVVAHSLGCHFALLNWEKNRNAKLVLVNPLLGKSSALHWIWAWLRFFLTEGVRYANPERAPLFFQFFRKSMLTLKLLRKDINGILFSMPAADVLIVRGETDYFFRSHLSDSHASKQGIEIIEVEGMGHNWKKNLLEEAIADKLK